MTRRHVLAAVALAGLFVAAGSIEFAGQADAHTLTGGSAQATCDDGTVNVTWTFVSGDAGTHTIQTVAFSRAVVSSSHTATTATAHTVETLGSTVALTATATFEDGFKSTRTVTTSIPADVCPPATTTTTTTTTPEVTTSTSSTTATAPPASVVAPSTTTPPPASSVGSTTSPPTAVPGTPTSVAKLNLPATGNSPWGPARIAAGIALIGCVLLFGVRRRGVER